MLSVTIFDIKRFALHDGPGIRTTVFFKGCPLDCWWCHNPESRKSSPETVSYVRQLDGKEMAYSHTYGRTMTVQDLLKEIVKDRLFFEESGGGVTFSGGEPLMQPEPLLTILKKCKRQGIHTTVDTCGHTQWPNLSKILPFTDLFLFDLKLVESKKHERYTGVKNELILKNLNLLLREKANVELRIPIIPGVHDGEKERMGYLDFLKHNLANVRVIHLLPYHTIADNKYKKLNMKNRMNGIGSIDPASLQAFKQELEASGFTVGIGG